MTQEKIDRINALARKAKTEGLTPEETAERDALRREYIESVTGNLKAQVCIAAFNIQVDFRTFVASAAQQDCNKTHDDRDAPFAT